MAPVVGAPSGQCVGGNAVCNYISQDKDCGSRGYDFDNWCTVNEYPNTFEPYCEGTIICGELTKDQCDYLAVSAISDPPCYWSTKNETYSIVTIVLGAITIFLLLITIGLLIKNGRKAPRRGEMLDQPLLADTSDDVEAGDA